MKRLVRQIMLSRAYQRSAEPVGSNRADDRYYSRYIVRRLPAEPLLDAIAQVTGVATEFKDLPKGTKALQLRDSQVESYFLTTFGRPLREKTCACERQRYPDIAQALQLSNGDVINARIRAAGGVCGSTSDGRASPTVKPSTAFTFQHSAGFRTAKNRQAAQTALAGAPVGAADPARKMRREVMEDLYWAVLTSREFVFNH